MPCKLTICQCTTFKERVFCKNWIPASDSVYAHCDYFNQYRQQCPFKVDKQPHPCEGCRYYDKQDYVGRPNNSGVDWSDPEQVNAYRRAKRKQCAKPSQSNPS